MVCKTPPASGESSGDSERRWMLPNTTTLSRSPAATIVAPRRQYVHSREGVAMSPAWRCSERGRTKPTRNRKIGAATVTVP